MTDDKAAIEKTLWTYLDGLHEGDTDKLASAFHPVAHLIRKRTERSPICRASNGSRWCAIARQRNRRGKSGTIASSASINPDR